MLKKWLKQPSFWVFVVISGLLLFLVFQLSIFATKMVFQAIEVAYKIPSQYLKYGWITIASLFVVCLLYRLWPEAKEKPTETPKPGEKEKPAEQSKNDPKDKKSEQSGSLLPALIFLLAVVLTGTFWRSEFSSILQNVNVAFKNNYVLGSVSRWDTDIKTGKPLPPKTFPAKIIQWDEGRIFIKIEGKNPVTMEWNKGLTRIGTWHQEGRSGTWWVPNIPNSDGFYAGWTLSDSSKIKEPMIIRKP
jgi:hypothetical protein